MGSRRKKQTVGYRYYMGAHLVLCHGPVNEINELKIGDRTFWSGASAGGQISVNLPDLHGGDRREGGISGALDILMGGPGQAVNDYLQARMAGGGTTPAFRGVVSLVLRQMYLSANSAVIKPIAAKVKRLNAGWDAQAPWVAWTYTAGDGMSPAAILYQCLTDRAWGMGHPPSGIDWESFSTAHDTLSNEGFGLNLVFDRQQPIEDFIQVVLDHINGVLRIDAQGRFSLFLVREFASGMLKLRPRYGPDNVIELESLERPAWQETVNEISVVYKDATSWQDKTVTVHNLANIQAQGGVVSARKDYPGITSDSLAAKVALRDLASMSVPLLRVTMLVDVRPMLLGKDGPYQYQDRWDIPLPGDVIWFDWPEHGLSNVLLRVGSVEIAEATDHAVRLVCVEDVFNARATELMVQNISGWSAPNMTAVAPAYSIAIEASYWDVARGNGPGDLAQFDATDTWITSIAVRGNDRQTQYLYYTGANIGEAVEVETGDYAPMGLLTADLALDISDAVITLTSDVDIAEFSTCEYAWLITAGGTPTEAVAILGVDATAKTLSIARAVLDTVPSAHAAGTRVLGVPPGFAVDITTRSSSETIGSWVASVTGTETGAKAVTTHGSSTLLSGRQGRPYPPGNVQYNGSHFPAVVAGDLVITWARRNRQQQTAYLVRQTEGDITPEIDQTTTIRIKDRVGTLVRTYSGIAGISQTWNVANAAADAGAMGDQISVEIESERDTLTSWKKQSLTILRAGYGLRYGQYYGGV